MPEASYRNPNEMNDPHVRCLHYRIALGEDVDYEKAAPLAVETGDFVLKVDSKEAVFEMKSHFPTKDGARATAEAFLRRWEVLSGLEQDPGDLKFVFHHADIIDRAPTPASTRIVNLQGTIHMHAGMKAAVHVSRGKFPSPPRNFALSLDVETMYARYKAYREGRESLLSMAFMCLTVLEASAGGRASAAKKYSIAMPVLNRLGYLCSERGGPEDARKTPKGRAFVPLSGQEKEWVTQVVRALIRRAGEQAHDPAGSLPQLTMQDFLVVDASQTL